MPISEVKLQDKKVFNHLALHPLQSWEWGEFRKKTGIEVIRLGRYKGVKLAETAQLTIHSIPFTSWTIGYLPKCNIPSEKMLEELVNIGKKHRCIFIKLEPHVSISNSPFSPAISGIPLRRDILNSQFSICYSPHPLFTKYTFLLDLTKSEEELLKNMHHKTRYNIRVAQKHKVKVVVDNSRKAFEEYLKLLWQTTKRQKFFAHDQRYHSLMWETLHPANIAYLLRAIYESNGKTYTLASWIIFLFNNVLYYPYGASSDQYRPFMASNLMMWEAIRFGKNHGAVLFDMWGALGPNPDPDDPWYGFHRFKQGYGARLTELAGSFDLVINPSLYQLYNFTNEVRKIFLKIKSNV